LQKVEKNSMRLAAKCWSEGIVNGRKFVNELEQNNLGYFCNIISENTSPP